MRIKMIPAATIVALSLAGVMAVPSVAQAGWRHISSVNSHDATDHDPYAYRYEPRAYYTNSASRYWRPAHKVHRHHKARGARSYRYHPAWGYKKARQTRRRWLW